MTPPRKNVSQATTAAPASSKGKRKAVEVTKSASCYPNLSDVHITVAEDSHPPRHRGLLQPRPTPDTPMSTSSRCFPARRSR